MSCFSGACQRAHRSASNNSSTRLPIKRHVYPTINVQLLPTERVPAQRRTTKAQQPLLYLGVDAWLFGERTGEEEEKGSATGEPPLALIPVGFEVEVAKSGAPDARNPESGDEAQTVLDNAYGRPIIASASYCKEGPLSNFDSCLKARWARRRFRQLRRVARPIKT
jgi:hypothetical protein